MTQLSMSSSVQPLLNMLGEHLKNNALKFKHVYYQNAAMIIFDNYYMIQYHIIDDNI